MKSAPYLNPDPYCQFIGPKNLGEVLIDSELTPVSWTMEHRSILSLLLMPIKGAWILCLSITSLKR